MHLIANLRPHPTFSSFTRRPHLWRTQIDLRGQQAVTKDYSTEDGSVRVVQELSTKYACNSGSLTDYSFIMKKQERPLRGSCYAWRSQSQERHGTSYERLKSSAMARIRISSKFLSLEIFQTLLTPLSIWNSVPSIWIKVFGRLFLFIALSGIRE